MQIVSNIALISINETFLVQLVSFLIFLFVFHRIMIRPLRDVMQQRQDMVTDIQQEMTAAQAELEESIRQIREQESEVLRVANEMRVQLEEEGNRQAQEIVAASRGEVEGLRREAESEISSLIGNARKSLQAESEKVASRIVEQILGRSVVS
jgi:F-type H+-transporting ATPase subunit b